MEASVSRALARSEDLHSHTFGSHSGDDLDFREAPLLQQRGGWTQRPASGEGQSAGGSRWHCLPVSSGAPLGRSQQDPELGRPWAPE